MALRKEIDKLDSGLVEILRRRMDISDEIRLIKFTNKMPIEDLQRENEIITKGSKTLPPKFVKDIYNLIFGMTKKQRWQK